MDDTMFCYQCEEALKGSGCTQAGTCGKQAPLSARMDLLMFMTRGLCIVADVLHEHKQKRDPRIDRMVIESLFSTVTNVNFDDLDIERRTVNCMELRYELMQQAEMAGVALPKVDEVTWLGLPIDFAEKARTVGVLREPDREIRAYKELITYGLKGMAAYLYHTMNLGKNSPELHHFLQHMMATLVLEQHDAGGWQRLMLDTGDYGLRTMALLDRAHDSALGNPQSDEVSTRPRKRPGILVSGHDMSDLRQLLEQCDGSGVDVYTHCEMLPAHYYPELRKYHCLVGHYGNSWWEQHHEFTAFHGPILMTSNCLVPIYTRESYQDRLYTTGPVAYGGARHIAADKHGNKDFGRIIEHARKCEAPEELSTTTLVGGFAHRQLAHRLDQILRLLAEDKIREFRVVAGCDGRLPYRQYYTDMVRRLPQDVVVLTGGCAKFRFLKEGLGEIGTLPRLLDVGQCNDTYSIVVFAAMLKDALGVADINDIPISYDLAWYEQKSVIVLLALLHLGIRNIRLGPKWPAFTTEDIRFVLREKFGLKEIRTAEEDARLSVSDFQQA